MIWIEATVPLRVKWAGQVLVLEPGRPMDLPDAQAQKLLTKVPSKVRVVEPALAPQPLVLRAGAQGWKNPWRQAAALTTGITDKDCRYKPILAQLDQLNAAYQAQDAENFSQLMAQLQEVVQPASTSPITPGWLVAYRGRDGKLHGGFDDREHGTVESGQLGRAGWTFTLTDGTVLPARAIVSVAQVAQNGRIVAAWTVRNFGFDGERQCLPWRVSESDR